MVGVCVEYNEPRGHWYMVTDQLEIDPSRIKAGGACLTCKTPYAPILEKQMGLSYFADPTLRCMPRSPRNFSPLVPVARTATIIRPWTWQLSRWTLRRP